MNYPKTTIDITEFEESVNLFFDCDDELQSLHLQAMATSIDIQRKMIAELSRQLQTSHCSESFTVN